LIPSPTPAEGPGLAILLVLAVVQGVTEFLPVSSDGHLVLVQNWLAAGEGSLAMDVALHLGTLAAVLVVYRRDLLELLRRLLAGDAREPLLILLATLPAVAVGLGLKHQIEALFASSRVAALGLFVTAGFLLLGERSRRRASAAPGPAAEITWRQALWIGCAQALAPLPGVSRSGTTIATALMRGVDASAAARFSFLMSIPAVAGAVALEVPGLVREGGFGLELALAVLVCFAVGVCALRFLIRFLGRGAFRWCAYYCLVLGTTALVLLR
jgi:undecaprenyl-diphosphatase